MPFKTLNLNSDPVEDTTEVNDEYLETVNTHGREFQKYSIDNNVHLVPIDDVAKLPGRAQGTDSDLDLGGGRATGTPAPCL